jgi:hypothetical protein
MHLHRDLGSAHGQGAGEDSETKTESSSVIWSANEPQGATGVGREAGWGRTASGTRSSGLC